MPNTLQYATEVKGPLTVDSAVAVFHDHKVFMDADPNLVSFKPVDEPSGGAKLHELPDEIKSIKAGGTRFYEVTDRVPGVGMVAKLLPGLSTTTIHYQITDTKDGVFIFLKAPLGVTEERRWVVERGGGDGVKIVEHVTSYCSKFIYGTVKAQQDQNWKGVHTKYAEKMGGAVAAQSTT